MSHLFRPREGFLLQGIFKEIRRFLAEFERSIAGHPLHDADTDPRSAAAGVAELRFE